MIRKLIRSLRPMQRFKTFYFTRKWKQQQRIWQKTIDIPDKTKFCPLLYHKCAKTNGSDTNCFETKSPGCYTFRKYLQGKTPRALITTRYCLEHLRDDDAETDI